MWTDRDDGKRPLPDDEAPKKAASVGAGHDLGDKTGADAIPDDPKKPWLKRPASGLKTALSERIFEQTEAVIEVVAAYRRMAMGLTAEERPLASMLFTGPTGVGKTETAKIMAEYMGWPLFRFDMSEFSERHTASAFLGSPAGYVGSDSPSRISTLSETGHGIVLLDEIEKAHEDIQRIFLQALDNGEVTDRAGRKINFRNMIVIMTSNVGSQLREKETLGFTALPSTQAGDGQAGRTPSEEARGRTKAEESQRRKEAIETLARSFAPEFLGRFGAIIRFERLSDDGLARVLRKKASEVSRLPGMMQRRLILEIGQAGVTRIVEKAKADGLGARPVAHTVDREVVSLLAVELDEGGQLTDASFKRVIADYTGGAWRVTASDLSEGERLRIDVEASKVADRSATNGLPVETGKSLREFAKESKTPFTVKKTSYTKSNLEQIAQGRPFLPLDTVVVVYARDVDGSVSALVASPGSSTYVRKYEGSELDLKIFSLY